jgi:hypothetical protein
LISDCGLFDVPGQTFKVFLPTPPLPSTFQPEKSIAQSSFSTHFAIPSQLQLAPTTHAVTTAVKSASKEGGQTAPYGITAAQATLLDFPSDRFISS